MLTLQETCSSEPNCAWSSTGTCETHACTSILTSSACIAASCAWTGLRCTASFAFAVCAALTTQDTCSSDFNCVWSSAGACEARSLDYAMVTEKTCEGFGMEAISTENECVLAASALKLSDTTPTYFTSAQASKPWVPYGCIWKWKRNGDGTYHLQWNPTNTGNESSQTFVQICTMPSSDRRLRSNVTSKNANGSFHV
jgi:hypothetical protein